MQQFASAQPSIAASKLPFEDLQLSSNAVKEANNSATSDNASNDRKGLNEGFNPSHAKNNTQPSAFKEALAKQEQRSKDDAAIADKAADKAAEKAVELRQEIQREQNNTKRKSIEGQVPANESVSSSQAAQKSGSSNEMAARSEEHVRQDKSPSFKESENALANKRSSEHVEPSSSSEALMSSAINESLADDFDWIAYVNQVKELTSDAKHIPNDLHLDNEKAELDIFAQTMATLSKGAEQDFSDAAMSNANVPEIEIVDALTDTEFLEISLSQDELATLINAAGGNAEDKLSLNTDAMTDLDKAIASLLNQLLSKQETGGKSETSIEKTEITEDADASLLKDLLQAGPVEKDAIQANKDGQSAMSHSIETDAESIQRANLAKNALGDSELSKQIQVDENLTKSIGIDGETSLSKNKTTKTSDELLAQRKPMEEKLSQDAKQLLVDAELETSASKIGPGIERSEKALKSASSSLIIPLDNLSNKKPVERLASLPPEIEANAIDNIAKRVEGIIAEIKSEGKSGDFIAALQSAVKEMKDQLKQGREPGIDLKTLVSDALAASEVRVSSNVDAALDKQLNQVTQILGLAASISQNTQQQNYLHAGLSDIQAAREVSQQQIESTRMAQQTAVNEKGVNIFKPEGQQQLTEKVRWMVNSRNLSAEIKLDPADLGGMNIKVNLSGDSATVNFVVQTQHARDALEQAVPKLRTLLEEQGIELGQSSVQQDSSGSNEQSEQENLANNSGASSNLAQQSQEQLNEEHVSDSAGVMEQRINGGRIGGIDYYA